MMKRVIGATALVVALASPALAFQCPGDMKKIDAALQTATLPGGVVAQVMALRQQGEAEHAGGKHSAAIATLATAMQLITDNS